MTSGHETSVRVFTQQQYRHERFSPFPMPSHLKGERVAVASGLSVSCFHFLGGLKGNMFKSKAGLQTYSLKILIPLSEHSEGWKCSEKKVKAAPNMMRFFFFWVFQESSSRHCRSGSQFPSSASNLMFTDEYNSRRTK